MKELEKIAQDVQNGVLTCHDGAIKIIILLYKNTKCFKLGMLSEDNLHDFLIATEPRIEKLLKKYNPKQGLFSIFFYKYIRNSTMTFLRTIANKNATEEVFFMVQKIDYEDNAYHYAKEAPESYTQTIFEKEQLQEQQRKAQAAVRELHKAMGFTLYKKNHRIKTREDKSALARTLCLILFLKSCYYVTPEIIQKTSIITGMNQETLRFLAEKVLSTLTHKIEVKEQNDKVRNKIFFYHLKYDIESRKVDSDSSRYQYLKQRCDSYTRKWKKHIKEINSMHCCNATPSNKAVGDVLQISDRKVEYILKHGKDNIDMISLNCYDDTHENLPGDEQSEQKERDV